MFAHLMWRVAYGDDKAAHSKAYTVQVPCRRRTKKKAARTRTASIFIVKTNSLKTIVVCLNERISHEATGVFDVDGRVLREAPHAHEEGFQQVAFGK